MQQLGLSAPASWVSTIALSMAGLALMLAYSPLADWIGTRLIDKPPNLGAFRALQQSRIKLVIGIVVAWTLGGFVEEIIFRGIVLQWVEALTKAWFGAPIAAAIAICIAAAGAGVVHLYQGPRAAAIITQLSILFGALFVASGHNLWSVILCHGMYDTIAFIRFANKKSRYAQFADESAG